MHAPPEKLAALRHLLAARFPTAPRAAARALRTGLPAIDDAAGGLPLGALTEFACTAPSCGSHLLLAQLLAATRAARTRAALVDTADAFDPASFPADLLAHLVWVRCPPRTASPPHSALADALAATDLLARDANLTLVILDLRHAPDRELRRTPATLWYRLQRAVAPADLALVVLTPRATVPSAQLRFTLATSHPAAALAAARPVLATALAPALERQRLPAALAG
ncbi:MAG: hypothetical protein RLZZ15_1261 [Verrucomicrobiota bacterium]